MTQYLALLLLVAGPWSVQDADPIATLIADLGAESVGVRESALQALIASGPRSIPHLRDALNSQDAEVQHRASCALSELDREEKLEGALKPRPPVTLSLQDIPFTQALEEVARQTGIQFEGAVHLSGRAITATVTRAPLMQVLDILAAGAELQWSFESDTTVCWRKNPPVSRPSCYSGRFRVSLSRIGVYRLSDFQQGHGLMWLFLETRVEPGIHPIAFPRFELSEILDEAGRELPRDSEVQECSPKGYLSDEVGLKSGATYESSPFSINNLDPSVKKLSKVRGRAIFLFPLDKAPLAITDLCGEPTVTRGNLVFSVSEILTNSLKLTLLSNGDVGHLDHHVDLDSLVLTNAEGRQYVRGADFEVRVEERHVDTLRYCVTFNENVSSAPIALRFLATGEFFEKVVPFEFKDVPLP